MAVRILYIDKQDRNNPWERILRIGGRNTDNTLWTCHQTTAIEYIEAGTYAFFVSVDGKQANVVVAKSAQGNKYIKTEADSFLVDNLLNLPAIPSN